MAAGKREIDGFVSLDFFSSYYYGSRKAFEKSGRVEYDLRGDSLPYDDKTVDNIYISHAIEHVEPKYVEQFIAESFRVLKPKGVLRIVCPDAKFLFEVSQFDNDYWNCKKKLLENNKIYSCNLDEVTISDYLVNELSTPKMRFYTWKTDDFLETFNVNQ